MIETQGRLALAVLLILATISWANAQDETATPANSNATQDSENAASQPLASPSTGSKLDRPQSAFPPNPYGFFRGNGPTQLVGPSRTVGFYFNWFLMLLILGAFCLWMNSSRWVDEDSRGLNLGTANWNSAMLFGGVGGMFLALILPKFIGLVPMAAAWGVPLGMYIRERNAKVPEARRVMTQAHIRRWTLKKLAAIGIHIGSRETIESTMGPPIQFLGKSEGSDRGEAERRSRQVENSKGYLAAKELIYDAINRRTTDVHLEPKEDELSIRIRIDGVMYPADGYDVATGRNILNIFKVLAGMDITERRRPQDGSFRAILEGREIDFRTATQGTRHGEKMSLRILDQTNSVGNLSDLGFRKSLFEQIVGIVDQPHGLFLSCGPTGAGKSTTLYAALREIDSYQRNIITVEDPVEYKMENVNQIEINTRAGQTFANSLRSILRQDPDVVMIGEIRDQETASIACQAANTGHMVFSTIHANDTITALYRMIELGVEPFMVANSVSAILAQRLTRRLCDVCREPYSPNADLMKRAGLPIDRIDHLYRPRLNGEAGRCRQCGGLGYYGRAGVFELLVITERMRDLIREKSPMSAIKAEARKNGMLTMQEEGLRLVVRGVTSVQELVRVVK
ncbi:GspE/PulE family protein [Thalassoroseus pseudoceratinae]|uniref:GspE/PulE family protein n=1 Tax=Thalassoroseus pseudoceratinae TaxID=2713176 RepID=UPI001F0FC49E|nr:GspE/PulE family protein [Thalassoroseus pseudoceratinae]